METYLKPYGDIELQRRMVSDRPRTNAFAAAIQEVVQPGHAVLDIGTGTGILAMLSAKAGAARVTAIEVTDIAEVARHLVKVNGLADRVDVQRRRASTLQLDHQVDVLISEWIGNGVFSEGMLHAVLEARDRHLAPGGRMLPAGVRVLMAPLDDAVMYHSEGPGFWREPIHGLDFSSIQESELNQGRSVQVKLDPAALLAPPQCILELDMHAATIEDVWYKGPYEFTAARDGVLSGFGLWFEAQLSPSVLLDTSPFCPETHWAQTYIPFFTQPVRRGERVSAEIQFSYDPDVEDIRRYVDMRIRIGDHEIDFEIE